MQKTTDFWVGDRFVRPSLGEIQLGLERVHIEPRSMEVLLALAGRPSEVIPKKELIQQVWGDAFVSDEVLTHAIWDLRRAFGDQAADPEFIQTIPKKGYRLIAPVKPVEPQLRRAGDRGQPGAQPTRTSSARVIIWGLVAVAILASAIWWTRNKEPAAPIIEPRQPEVALVLVVTDPSSGPPHWAERLDRHLDLELTGLPGVDVRSRVSCEAAPRVKVTYCLETMILSATDAGELGSKLIEPVSGQELYASRLQTLHSRSELAAYANELASFIRVFVDIAGDEHLIDPDIRPWISFARHDIGAISDFLLGVKYVYRNEIGGRDAMAAAIAKDPDFVAPHVLRTPTIVHEGDRETILAHRATLEGLYDEASAFEKPMIRWAMALIDGDPAEQIRHLRVALTQERQNRPALLVLGVAHLTQGDADEGCRIVVDLLERQWDFPGLYPLAAAGGIHRDDLDIVRHGLALALNYETVDVDIYALLRLLAIYDGDAEKTAAYDKKLTVRLKEMSPQGLDEELLQSASEYHVALAESAGRAKIAARLRESVD